VANAAEAAGEWTEEKVRAIVAAHDRERGPLLPVLHDLQAEFGCIDQRTVTVVADALNLSVAEVHGVVSFYKDFRREPAGRRTVTVCRAEACQAVGGWALAEHARQRLGVDFGSTTPDGAITLEHVFCFGNCALGPSVMVDERLVGRVDGDAFDRLVSDTR
jgi:formate dehydrogenase subunit gamma